jgi:hypothetical protein
MSLASSTTMSSWVLSMKLELDVGHRRWRTVSGKRWISGEWRKAQTELEKLKNFAEVAQMAILKADKMQEGGDLHHIYQETHDALATTSNALGRFQNSRTRLEIEVRA